jgi:hypothetical protein
VPEIVDPAVGQVWESLDPRDTKTVGGVDVPRQFLLIREERVGGHIEFLTRNLRTGTISRIKEDRLRPRSWGYKFIRYKTDADGDD